MPVYPGKLLEAASCRMSYDVWQTEVFMFSGTQRPRIYVYDLPARFQNSTGVMALEDYDTWCYGAEKRVPEVRTLFDGYHI